MLCEYHDILRWSPKDDDQGLLGVYWMNPHRTQKPSIHQLARV
jgi:hypothetical protein